MHTCDSSTPDAEGRLLQIGCQPGVHRELQVSQGYVVPHPSSIKRNTAPNLHKQLGHIPTKLYFYHCNI